MEKYGDHFNIDVLVAVTNCTSILGVYSAGPLVEPLKPLETFNLVAIL